MRVRDGKIVEGLGYMKGFHNSCYSGTVARGLSCGGRTNRLHALKGETL